MGRIQISIDIDMSTHTKVKDNGHREKADSLLSMGLL